MNHQQQLRAVDFKPFLVKSDAQAFYSVLVNYAIIAVAFMLPAFWFNPFTVVISIILLGNRQLGLGILMHDCVHNGLFNNKSLNKTIGSWLCAAPILAQFEGYRNYHLKHHAKAGTTEDPDYPNYALYPVSAKSFKRKVLRDLLGITGVKNLYILFLMHAGLLQYDMSYQSHSVENKLQLSKVLTCLVKNLYQGVLFHITLCAILYWSNNLWLYTLWWGAYLTTFMLFSRIRNAAEHANVPNLLSPDPRMHARTVYANWWEKLTVAPNEVNYHLEHHWMPAIPPYQLAGFHQLLLDNGLIDKREIVSSYSVLLRHLIKQ